MGFHDNVSYIMYLGCSRNNIIYIFLGDIIPVLSWNKVLLTDMMEISVFLSPKLYEKVLCNILAWAITIWIRCHVDDTSWCVKEYGWCWISIWTKYYNCAIEFYCFVSCIIEICCGRINVIISHQISLTIWPKCVRWSQCYYLHATLMIKTFCL